MFSNFSRPGGVLDTVRVVRLFVALDVSQHFGDESKKLIERLKPNRSGRPNMFDSSFESARLNSCFRAKLNHEGRLVFPSIHRMLPSFPIGGNNRPILNASHKPAVIFR